MANLEHLRLSDWTSNMTDQCQQIKEQMAITKKIAQEANKARIDSFDFVEPCEPDCSPERHAYHQGQWNMAGRINKHFGLPPRPGALTADKEQA